jgi:hypothetical protein
MLDGWYYYRNGDKSTYYNPGRRGSAYTVLNGNVYRKLTGSLLRDDLLEREIERILTCHVFLGG